MNAKVRFTNYDGKVYDQDIDTYIANKLTRTYYDDHGAVEEADQKAEQTARGVGKLVQLLHSKQLITDTEVFDLANEHGYERERYSITK